MKRAISLIIVIALVTVFLSLTFASNVLAQEVTLSADGSLTDALTQVADGGTIVVDGTVAVTEAPGKHDNYGKNVTITGGTLDFTGLSGNLYLYDHITFENITLTFKADVSPAPAIFADGYTVKVGEGVTMPNPIRIFGGKNGNTTASTNLTLLSGYYTGIYGGGSNTDITGDVNLYVGGNVNSNIDTTSHDHTYCVHGGSYIAADSTNTIGGSVNVVFAGANANYLYGGNQGAGSCSIAGGINLTVSSGNVMSVYGGSRGDGSSLSSDVNVQISGGTIEQLFGGSEGGSVTGDVAVDVAGGTITRRVYGGCYNDYDSGWGSSNYVTGQIALTLHSGANIDFSSDSSDRAIYAHSRQSNLSDTEVSHLIYADSTAYSNYKDKVKAQDLSMQIIMSSTSAADHIHYHTYSASGATITQSCIDSSCSATATVVVEEAPLYNGIAVEPAKVVYSGNWWFGGELDVTYANNNQAGTATASITCGGATAEQSFQIIAPNLSMNGEGYLSLEEAIAAARKTEGADTITLLQDVEISTHVVINSDVTITADQAVTISAADSQTGGMFRIIGGTFTVAGASEDAKITLAAGKSTTHIVSNTGGDVVLTNASLAGNENTVYTGNNKTHGIFNNEGTVTAKSVDITGIKGDSIYVMDGTTVNLDNVTISGSGRYGIKVKGTLNISNTVHSNHALSISGTTDHAIDVENGGKVVCDFTDVPADTYVINFSDNARKGLNVRKGGNATLSYVSEN